MMNARRRAAARNGLAAMLIGLAAAPAPAFAEGGQNFVLPLVTAIAVASAARNAPIQVGTMQPDRRPIVSLIPSQVQFENGYEIDVNDYIGLHDPVAVIDADRVAAFDVLRHRRRGWMASFVYDTESRGPLAGGDDVFRVMFDYRF
jgi:hypothetical protein